MRWIAAGKRQGLQVHSSHIAKQHQISVLSERLFVKLPGLTASYANHVTPKIIRSGPSGPA